MELYLQLEGCLRASTLWQVLDIWCMVSLSFIQLMIQKKLPLPSPTPQDTRDTRSTSPTVTSRV